jgi:hypothetical protein
MLPTLHKKASSIAHPPRAGDHQRLREMASTIMSKDSYASFYSKEPLVFNLKYDQGRTRTRLA